MPGSQLATKITTEEGEVTDSKLMEEDPIFQRGFVARATILPMGVGEAALWIGLAPGTTESVRDEAERRGLKDYDARVPTIELALGNPKKGTQAVIGMGPKEGAWISNRWGNYPILLVSPTYPRMNNEE